MDAALSNEEFERIQNQMLELKSSNYTLEEEKRRIQHELLALKSKNEELEKQLNKAQTVAKINPLSIARNFAVKVDHKLRDNKEGPVNAENLILQQQLSQENDHLLKRIEAQEKDFQVTNETLRTEIVFLQERNQKLESKVIFLENEYKTLENRLKSVQNKQNHDENEGEDEDNELSSKEPKCCLILSDPNECSPKNELSFSVLTEKEKLESQILQLNELVDSLKKENQLVTTQLEELEDKYKGIDDIQTQLDQRNKLIQQQNEIITDLKCQIEEIEQKSKQQIVYLNSQHSNKIQELESKLISEKNKSEKYQQELNVLNENLTQLSNVKLENEKLKNDVDSYKEELSFCKSHFEEKLRQNERENEDKLQKLIDSYEDEMADLKKECDEYKNKTIELENQLKESKQEILDGIEERKIHEKKGVVIVKELKRTLQSERKRADKLQERLQELLNESTSNISVEIQRKQNLSGNGNGNSNANNNNDSSSVGSWSFMSGKDASTNRRTSSVHSMGSDGRDHTPPFSPINENQELRSQSVIERENAELVSRLTAMQQEKWALEEKINQLELNNSDMIDDINRKNKIIQYYCMEGRSDPHSVHHLAHNDSKLTVKRVVDFIKDKGDENLREINRKVQRMLEETLTKNMHLQQNLETMSNELFHLKKLLQQEENGKVNLN